jgi:hypothetical protein
LGPTAALARSQRLQAAAAAATAEHLHIVSKESRRNVVRGVNTLDQVKYLHIVSKENLHIADRAHRHFPDSSYGNCLGPVTPENAVQKKAQQLRSAGTTGSTPRRQQRQGVRRCRGMRGGRGRDVRAARLGPKTSRRRIRAGGA